MATRRWCGSASPGLAAAGAGVIGIRAGVGVWGAGGLAGTLAAGMLADWVLPFLYNIKITGMRASVLGWLSLGGLVALEETTRRARELRSLVKEESPNV